MGVKPTDTLNDLRKDGLHKPVTLAIDIQSFQGMSREDAQNFSKALGQKLTELRAANIPVIWVAIAPGGQKLLKPESASTEPHPLATLEEMGFTGHIPTELNRNHDIYASFLANYGPRQNEALYRKPAMSALVTIDDTNETQRVLEQNGTKLTQHQSADDHPETIYIEPEEQEQRFKALFGDETSLHEYLQDQGTDATYIIGAVSRYCVTETAITSATKGYTTYIDPNLVLSWKFPVDRPDTGILMWENFDHSANINQALAAAQADKSRSISPDIISKIRILPTRSAAQQDAAIATEEITHQDTSASSASHTGAPTPPTLDVKMV